MVTLEVYGWLIGDYEIGKDTILSSKDTGRVTEAAVSLQEEL